MYVNILKIILVITLLLNFSRLSFGQKYNQSNKIKLIESIGFIEFTQNNENTKIDTLVKSGKIFSKKHIEHKNPKIALFIACVPGFLLHGAGHLYAGHKNVFKILLIEEIIWLAAGIFVTYTTPVGGDSMNPNATGNDLYFLWTFLYLGPWTYDIIASPIICIRDNENKKKSLSINPYLNKDLFGHQVGIGLYYWF